MKAYRFLKQVQGEARKVVWPSRQETIRTGEGIAALARRGDLWIGHAFAEE